MADFLHARIEPFHCGTQRLSTAPVAVGYQFLNCSADQFGQTTKALGNAHAPEALKLFLRESESDHSGLRLEHCEGLRIPAKANAVPKGNRTVFRAEAEHYRSVATLAF